MNKMTNQEIATAIYTEENKNSLIAEVRKIAKRVNQNFVRIEKAGLTDSSYAYKFAQDALKEHKDIASAKTKGQQIENYRFEESKKALENMTVDQLTKELRQLKQFDKSKTRSVGGTNQVNKNKTKGLTDFLETEIGRKPNKDEIKDIQRIFGETQKYANIDRKIFSNMVINKLKSGQLSNTNTSEILEILKEANEYTKAQLELKGYTEESMTRKEIFNRSAAIKPKVKTDKQALLLNELFGVDIFGFQDYAPDITENDGYTKNDLPGFGGL